MNFEAQLNTIYKRIDKLKLNIEALKNINEILQKKLDKFYQYKTKVSDK